jgi:demethylmenaquinone methyltransferase / 2-methoxy-6-polyprenyl-1,4-benzoquinol methylase
MIPRISTVTYPSMNLPLPEGEPSKQDYIRSLFDGIAPHYDFLNHFLSSGIDILWRRRAIRLLRDFRPQSILDVATGTADLAIEAARSLGSNVIGVDISNEMLALGRKKILEKGVAPFISLKLGAAESLDFGNGAFDAVTVAFGVRNFSDVRRGLTEMHRVLRPGGIAMILEFSKPRAFPMRQLYNAYFHLVLPMLAGLVSKNRASYEYLPKSVKEFPDDKAFLALLDSIGYTNTVQYRLTFGIATIYLGTKPSL